MRIKRYGRALSIVSGRLFIPWGLHVVVRVFPAWFLFGISASRDDDGELDLTIGLVVVSVWVTPMRYLTRKELARRRDELAEWAAPRLVEDVERFLDEQ